MEYVVKGKKGPAAGIIFTDIDEACEYARKLSLEYSCDQTVSKLVDVQTFHADTSSCQ